MNFREFFNMFLKYAIFGAVIFLVVYKVPSTAVAEKDNLMITLVSVAVFILLEMSSGWFTMLKDFICGCKSSKSYDSSIDKSLVI